MIKFVDLVFLTWSPFLCFFFFLVVFFVSQRTLYLEKEFASFSEAAFCRFRGGRWWREQNVMVIKFNNGASHSFYALLVIVSFISFFLLFFLYILVIA